MATTSRIPVWTIKLITVVCCAIVLFVIFKVDPGARSSYPRSFIIFAVTVGALLGWSLGSVLQLVLSFHNVEALLNCTLTVLALLSLGLVANYIFNTNDSSHSDRYKYFLSLGGCFIVQSVVCLLMLCWARTGNIVIVQSV